MNWNNLSDDSLSQYVTFDDKHNCGQKDGHTEGLQKVYHNTPPLKCVCVLGGGGGKGVKLMKGI